MDTLFPQRSSDECRVCREDVVDGRWSYCSVRCRRIARAVQRMFIWDIVREQVLERDDYTCQSCGWSLLELQEKIHTARRDGDRDEVSRLKDERRTLEVDHITRLSDGGHPLDESNLQTLCAACHTDKTAEENRKAAEKPEVPLSEYFDDE